MFVGFAGYGAIGRGVRYGHGDRFTCSNALNDFRGNGVWGGWLMVCERGGNWRLLMVLGRAGSCWFM